MKPKPKQNQKPKRRVGRPEIPYDPRYALQVRHVAALGAKNGEIGKVFGVTLPTLLKWRREHPEFAFAIKEGREDPDNRVEASLFRRAIKGDVTACIFWLKCRRPTVWRDRRQLEEGDGANPTRDQIRGMSSAALRQLLAPREEPKVIELLPAPTQQATNGNGHT